MDPVCNHPEIPRYTSRPFPAYRYIPHQAPHPIVDPEGHSYAAEEEYLDSFSPADWHSCEAYLYGVDLFNHGYWWEAHEAFELIWLTAGRNSATGIFAQGLIQVAAALLKNFMKEPVAAARLAATGLTKLQVEGPIFLGIEVAPFCSAIDKYLHEKNAAYPRIRLVR